MMLISGYFIQDDKVDIAICDFRVPDGSYFLFVGLCCDMN